MSDVLLFANPIAGRGRGKKIAEQIARALEAQKVTVRTFWNAAATVTDEQLRTDARPLAAIAVGGDGTLRAVGERLLRFAAEDVTRVPPILIAPLGTANLMARHLSISWDTQSIGEQVARAILNQKIQLIDAARANQRLFLLMAGIGIDAAVVHELDRIRSGPIDYISYAVPALVAIQDYDYPPLTVTIDGQRVLSHQPAMAFVGNAPEYGTGFPILTLAKSNDDLLDVCILPCTSRMQVFKLLMAVATGDHLHEEGVIYQKGRSIRIESDVQVPVQIDGEASGHTPLEIELLPHRLPFIVQ